jgi:hypothetical protein
MSSGTGLTDADIKAVQRAPQGWFEWFDFMVRCPEFRLKRLRDRGLVEQKITGTWPDIEVRYRVITKAADAAVAAWLKER